jgi:uncharacterized protein (TIGR04255 family)
MVQGQPKFDAPPVIETVLSVQFSRLPGFSTAHAGRFWADYVGVPAKIGGAWSRANDAARLEDQFERFGVNDAWGRVGLKLTNASEPRRTQIIRDDEERMIQIQDSRLILNWRKRDGGYPSYGTLLPEFKALLSAFEAFVAGAGLGKVELNQWELAYVNHIPRGEMWDTPRDWPKIIPGLFIPPAVGGGKDPPLHENVGGGDWRFALADQRGRLFVSLRHSKMAPTDSPELLDLTLTTRGPVTKSESWEQGLDLGHDAIVRTFAAMTSAESHRTWKRRT